MVRRMPTLALVTTADAVVRLGVSACTVVRMVDNGRLTPQTKLAGLRGAYLFDRRDVEALAASRESVAS